MAGMRFGGVFMRGGTFVLCFSFFVILALGYSYVMHPLPTYFASRLEFVSLEMIILLSIVASLPVFLAPAQLSQASSLVFFLVYLTVVGPSIVIQPLLSGEVDIPFISLVLGCSCFVLLFAWVRPPKIRFSMTYSFEKTLYFLIFIMLAFFVIYTCFFYSGGLRLVGVNDVYSLRSEYRDNSGPLMRYLMGWVGGAVAPFAIVYGISRHKKILIVLGVFSMFLIYMAAGHKSTLLSMVLMVFSLFFLKDKVRSFLLVAILMGGTLLCLSIDFFTARALVTPFSIDRFLIAPAVLNYLYYDFFSVNGVVLWGHSFLNGLVEYSYDVQPAFLIGRTFFVEGVQANAGFLADGYANFEYFGVAALLLLLAILVLAYEAVSSGFSFAQKVSIFIPQFFFLANASPITSILTNGFLLLLLLALFSSPDSSRDTQEVEVEG